MTKKNSDTATALMEPPVSTIRTPLTLAFCASAGPRPDKFNLWVDIEVDLENGIALFHCAQKERVGAHPNRTVTYRADNACRLTFTNRDVFGVASVDLKTNQQKRMQVPSNTENISADYGVEVEATSEQIAKWAERAKTTVRASMDVLAGPHIVVP